MKLKTTLLLLFISVNVAAQSPAKTIPAFSFYKAGKILFTEKQLAAGKLLFFIFFDADCDHCQRTIAYFNQHYNELKRSAVYLITIDDWGKANEFIRKFGKNFSGKTNVTLLQDLNNEFIRKFGPKKYPSVFLYSSGKQLILYDDEEKNMPFFLARIKTHQ